ncbi:von Willebrand factor type A domain-containing protein, partial [Chamaesiphon sp. OTE_8_metabat_110]|uniref:von Willebrand factor type A domain-containing protein n=1 Tax=Chamaesiphon sp. OTE_8_metabat_110 TaxID=2964696 RepID=UPI00286C45E8
MSDSTRSAYRSIVVYTSLVVLLGNLAACGAGSQKSSAPTSGASTQTASTPRAAGLESKTGSSMDTTEAAQTGFSPPEVATDESYKSIADNQFYTADRQPLSTFSIDVDAASYSNVRRFINEGQLPPKDAVRIEEMVNYFPYDYPQPTGDKPFSINTEVATAPWNPQHKLVQIGLQGRKIGMEKLPPNNLV